MNQQKIRVAVLYGGRSAEHEVSLQSAANVIQFLDPNRFEVIPIGIDKQGNWFMGHEVFQQSLAHCHVPALTNAWFTPNWVSRPSTAQHVKDLMLGDHAFFDVIFPVVHGPLCEDGSLQGLLELAHVPYVGSGVLGSAIGMDKDVAKRLAQAAGFLVGPYLTIKHYQWEKDPQQIQQAVAKLSYPVFVKPANTGSSIGITKVKTPDQLTNAIDTAFHFDTKVLIEQALIVSELEVAVLESLEETQSPLVSLVGEIKPHYEFYSYDAKYVDQQGADLLIPAAISDSAKHTAQAMAVKLFHLLECEGMARVDLFLNHANQKIYFNELNTIPGFTEISMYPKLMAASGIPYSALLTQLVELAIKRFKNKSKLVRQLVSDKK